MSAPSSTVDVVQQFMKLMAPLDDDEALKLVSEICEYANPPPFGNVHGPAGIRSVLNWFFGLTL